MRLPGARQHDDQLVGATAIRREAGDRVMDALELIVGVDEMLALRGLVWLWLRLWDAREGRAEGDQGRDHDEPHLITETEQERFDCRCRTSN